MTDQEVAKFVIDLAGSTSIWAAPTVILAVLLSRAKGVQREKLAELEKDRDEWRSIAINAKDLATKNYEAGLSWKAAFERRSAPSRASKQPAAPTGPAVPGHCHDARCAAKELKLHACHDLTCRAHLHESRAR